MTRTTWIVVIVLAALLGLQSVRLANERADHAKTESAYQRERAAAAQANQRAEKAERAEESRREQEKENVREQARMESQRIAAGRAAADLASRNLLDAARALAVRACDAGPRPDPDFGGTPAASPADLLADVLGELDAAGRDLAEEADRRRAAGLACERSYDSLNVRPTSP